MVDQTLMKVIKISMNMIRGFLYGRKHGIDKDNTVEDDYADDKDNRKPTNPNIVSTGQQAK